MRRYPLAHRQVGQDVVGEVGGEFGHVPGVAGETEAAALAEECDQAFMATVLTARACEAVGEDPTPEVGPEVLLHPGGEPAAHGVGAGGSRSSTASLFRGTDVLVLPGARPGAAHLTVRRLGPTTATSGCHAPGMPTPPPSADTPGTSSPSPGGSWPRCSRRAASPSRRRWPAPCRSRSRGPGC